MCSSARNLGRMDQESTGSKGPSSLQRVPSSRPSLERHESMAVSTRDPVRLLLFVIASVTLHVVLGRHGYLTSAKQISWRFASVLSYAPCRSHFSVERANRNVRLGFGWIMCDGQVASWPPLTRASNGILPFDFADSFKSFQHLIVFTGREGFWGPRLDNIRHNATSLESVARPSDVGCLGHDHHVSRSHFEA